MSDAITIVDDSCELRHLLSLLLESELGIICLGLASLDDVLANSEQVIASRAAILDINLGPGQPDGVAVYRWLQDHSYGGRTFFFTGHAKDSPYVKEAARTGVPILEKPMDLDEFLPIIKSAFNSKKHEAIQW